MKRPELMRELNKLLNVSHNWSRISKLDLERLVDAIKERYAEDRDFDTEALDCKEEAIRAEMGLGR